MTPKTKLGELLESRRKTTPISIYAEILNITRGSYYRILHGRDVDISTLLRIANALKLDSRSIVLSAYCDIDVFIVREGINHQDALKLLLKTQRGACYNIGLFRKTPHTIRTLRAIAEQKPVINGCAIGLTDLVLAAYFGELPNCIFD